MYGRWTPAVGILKKLSWGKRRTAIIGHEKLELISVTASQRFHDQDVGDCRRIRFEDKPVHHGVKSRVNHIGGDKIVGISEPTAAGTPSQSVGRADGTVGENNRFRRQNDRVRSLSVSSPRTGM